MNQRLTIAILGYGGRGRTYARYALKHPERLKVVAVAEPNPDRLQNAAKAHGLSQEVLFTHWKDFFQKPIAADGVVIATQDIMHVEPAVSAMKAGYHVLLEKPMALTPEDCERLVQVSQETQKSLNICHVLRYVEMLRKVKDIIDSGRLGKLTSVFHSENVTYAHMAHSFVRGHWSNSEASSPIVLAKTCHDLDLLVWWIGQKPRRVSSMGSISQFQSSRAPKGAPQRCLDGCPAAETCLYEAKRTYLDGRWVKQCLVDSGDFVTKMGIRFMLRHPRLASKLPLFKSYYPWTEWPTNVLTENLTEEGILEALKTGPYGRCVYHCDNDQPDHQDTIIEFEEGTTAILRLNAHSHREERTFRIDGEKGSLRGTFGSKPRLELHQHLDGSVTHFSLNARSTGHREGDERIMEEFVDVLQGEPGKTSAADSATSHFLAFAAHRARMTSQVVEL